MITNPHDLSDSEGFAQSLEVASAPNYLGDVKVIHKLLQDFGLVALKNSSIADTEAKRLAVILLGMDPVFPSMPAWNKPGAIDVFLKSAIPMDVAGPEPVVATAILKFAKELQAVVEHASKPGVADAECQSMVNSIINHYAYLFLGIDNSSIQHSKEPGSESSGPQTKEPCNLTSAKPAANRSHMAPGTTQQSTSSLELTALPQIVTRQPAGEDERRALRVLQMVHELHKAGYQRIRICPGMSASGGSWRCAVTPMDNIERNHGAMLVDWDNGVARYTSGQKNHYFEWMDAESDTARELAAKFIARFPEIARRGLGQDWSYAGWYVQMLGFAEREEFPTAYADWHGTPHPNWLSTDRNLISKLPMPPLPAG